MVEKILREIIKESCESCPLFISYGHSDHHQCLYSNEWIEDTEEILIPDWCPLENHDSGIEDRIDQILSRIDTIESLLNEIHKQHADLKYLLKLDDDHLSGEFYK
jgi:hypothetical protein